MPKKAMKRQSSPRMGTLHLIIAIDDEGTCGAEDLTAYTGRTKKTKREQALRDAASAASAGLTDVFDLYELEMDVRLPERLPPMHIDPARVRRLQGVKP